MVIKTFDGRILFCENQSCNRVFFGDIRESEVKGFILCPDCKDDLEYFNFVQCNSCNSIVDIIPSFDEDAESSVYTIESCSKCSNERKEISERYVEKLPGIFTK